MHGPIHVQATAILFLPFPSACFLEPQGLLTLLCPLDFPTAPRYEWKGFAQHTDDKRAVISVVVLVMMEEDTRPYPAAAGTGHSSRHCCQSPASRLVQLHVPLAAETQTTGGAMVSSALQPPQPQHLRVWQTHHIMCNPPQLPPRNETVGLLASRGSLLCV